MGYKQSKERNQRLKKLYEETKHSYVKGVYYDKHKKRLIRYSLRNKSTYARFLRKCANRTVRRNKDELMNHSTYRKQFDYWWELS